MFFKFPFKITFLNNCLITFKDAFLNYLLNIHQKHYIGIQIRRETKELLDSYCDKQREATGIKLSKVDIVDLAVRSIVQHDNFFQFAIDFQNNNK